MADTRLFSFRASRHKRHSKTRFFALVDGVFAIATTLLVLELHVDKSAIAHGQLAHVLRRQLPEFGAYAIGFLQTFGGWSVSHRLSARLRGINQWMILSLGIGLAFVSLIPFSTAVLADSFGDNANLKVAVALVAGLGFASTVTLAAATQHAWKVGLMIDEYHQDHYEWLARLMLAALVGFGLATVMAFVVPWVALVPLLVGYAATLLPLRMDEFPCAQED
ncbi:MAG TPA: TMEM175 family protein [Acidimicrobiales bacterium]|nr:TMEM175 family protein [Acidimicrobiales bacterium]